MFDTYKKIRLPLPKNRQSDYQGKFHAISSLQNITPYSASSIKESIAEAETLLCSDKKGIKRYIRSCYSVPVYCNTGSPPTSS